LKTGWSEGSINKWGHRLFMTYPSPPLKKGKQETSAIEHKSERGGDSPLTLREEWKFKSGGYCGEGDFI